MGITKVALLQMTGRGADRNASRVKGEAFCRRAHSTGADAALFPEIWSNGMRFYDPIQPAEAEEWLRHLAR